MPRAHSFTRDLSSPFTLAPSDRSKRIFFCKDEQKIAGAGPCVGTLDLDMEMFPCAQQADAAEAGVDRKETELLLMRRLERAGAVEILKKPGNVSGRDHSFIQIFDLRCSRRRIAVRKQECRRSAKTVERALPCSVRGSVGQPEGGEKVKGER